MPLLEPVESDLAEEPGALPPSSSSPNIVAVGLDLAFSDQALEEEFIKFHNESQVFNDVRSPY